MLENGTFNDDKDTRPSNGHFDQVLPVNINIRAHQ